MAEYCPGSETRSEADESLTVLLVNLAGLLAGGVVTRLGTRVWARRIEAGQAIFRAETAATPVTEIAGPSQPVHVALRFPSPGDPVRG
jgi:hypothetical protein